MLNAPVIDEQQIKQFKQDGFLILKNAFNEQETADIERWAAELAAMPEKSGTQWVFHETSKLDPEESLISRIEYISPFHKGFLELGNVLKKPVAQLLGEEAVLFKEKINFKNIFMILE